jgi:hypothetical protein
MSASSDRKNDSMTSRTRRNASNSRNESSNRYANTVGTLAKAEALVSIEASVTACRKAKFSRGVPFHQGCQQQR